MLSRTSRAEQAHASCFCSSLQSSNIMTWYVYIVVVRAQHEKGALLATTGSAIAEEAMNAALATTVSVGFREPLLGDFRECLINKPFDQ